MLRIQEPGRPTQSRDTSAITTVPVPEPSALALRRYRTSHPLWLADTALGLVLPAILLFTGFSAKLRTAASRVGRGRWLVTVAGYGVLYVIVTSLVMLPLSWYRGFIREHEYGLSQETFSQWFVDWTKMLGFECLLAAIGLWIPYLLLRKSPRRWWLWTSLATAPLAAFLMLVQPVLVDPAFNEFGPMRDQALEARILALAAQAGIDADRVYEVAKSEETKAVNAYVTGLGSSERIVLWDNLVDRMQPDEVVFVMGHEMGHFVLNHVPMFILILALLSLMSLYAVHRIAGRLIAKFHRHFGFDRLSDPASLPLFSLVGGVVMLAVTPALLGVSRWREREADRFGLEITRDGHAAARAFVRLQEDNLAVPRTGLLYRLWRASHPDLADRIEFANRYRPWAIGDSLRYGHMFQQPRPPAK